MTKCPACDCESIAVRVDPRGGSIRRCNDCGHEEVQRDQPEPERQASAPPVAAAATRATKSDPSEPLDPMPALKARRRWLVSEIKRLRKLEAELASVDRILHAAGGKPVAVVRDLPKRAHG